MVKEETVVMTEALKQLIEKDLKKCEAALNGKENTKELYRQLYSKYPAIIDGFDDRLRIIHGPDDYIVNIKIMIEKLELFKAMDYKNVYKSDERKTLEESQLVINNSNVNTNNNDVNINISFDNVRGQVEAMTALTDSEIEEILEKINELEKIVESTDRKTRKWENAKGIIKWIADRGVDVGLALLPLVLKIQ